MLQQFCLRMIDVEPPFNPLPALVYEVIEEVFKYLNQLFATWNVLVALDLNEQTFLQGTCSDAWRVELLQDLEDVLQFLRSCVEALIDLSLVG